jgi:hypothetical protein
MKEKPELLKFEQRWIHIIFSIPILGYIYGPVSEVQQYAAEESNVWWHY